jgi:septation ring formation regulator EzrA
MDNIILEKLDQRIDTLENRIASIEAKINTIAEILQVFSLKNGNGNKIKTSSIIVAFLAGGVANMVGIYTLVRTIIEIFVNFRK